MRMASSAEPDQPAVGSSSGSILRRMTRKIHRWSTSAPYCGVAAEPGEWQTEEQMRYIEEEAVARVVGPALQELEDAFGSDGRSPVGSWRSV